MIFMGITFCFKLTNKELKQNALDSTVTILEIIIKKNDAIP